jgi:hypothetical protein
MKRRWEMDKNFLSYLHGEGQFRELSMAVMIILRWVLT